MNSRPRQATIAALAAAALLAFPTAASGSIDYSKNAATGRHAPAEPHDEEIYVNPATGHFAAEKDYSQNAATGDVPDQTPKVQIVTVAEDGSFAWGDAAVGAGVALALGLIAYVTTTAIRRRRIASPAT